MRKIRLVACDMDGTFLGSDRIPHPLNLESAKSLLQSGVVFCLASGRGIPTMRPFLDELGITGPVVSSNGAHVRGLDGEVVFDARLSTHAIHEVVDYAEKHGIHLNRYYGETITFSGDGANAELYRARTGCDPQIEPLGRTRELPATKLLFVAPAPETENHFGHFSSVTDSNDFTLVRSEPEYLEFLPAGVTKGVGVQRLAEHLKIQATECAAIGDWLNDFEMLQWVGRSACVANAHPEIQAICPEIYPDHDSGGVSLFLQAVLDSNARVY